MNIEKLSEINLRSYIKNIFRNELEEIYKYNDTTNVFGHTNKNSIKVYFIESFNFNDIYNTLSLPKELINIIYEYCSFCFEIIEVELSKYCSPYYNSIGCYITCKIFDFVYDYYIMFNSKGDFSCRICENKNDKSIYKSTPKNNSIAYFFNDFMKRLYNEYQYFPTSSLSLYESIHWENNIWTYTYRLMFKNNINVIEVINYDLVTSIIHIFKIIFNIFADEVYNKYNDELQTVIKMEIIVR